MEMNDMKNFASLMATIGEIYAKTISETLIEIYWQILKPFAWTHVKEAVSHHIADPHTGQFIPKPSDIVGRIEGKNEEKALQAWLDVFSAIQRYGAYQSIIFEDKTIHAAIDAMGGWKTLCASKTENMPTNARLFQKYYLSFLKNPATHAPPHLSGIFASEPIFIPHPKEFKPLTRSKQTNIGKCDHADKSNNTI